MLRSLAGRFRCWVSSCSSENTAEEAEESHGDGRAQGELQGQPSLGAGPAVLNPCRKGSGPEGFCFIGVRVNSRLKALPGDACRAGPRAVTLAGFHSHSQVPFQAFFCPGTS